MSTPTMDDAAKVLADPLAYTDEPKLHAALAHLRANAPVSWVEVPNYRPFWAITKHADVMDIERANALFTNWPRPVLTTQEGDELQAAGSLHKERHDAAVWSERIGYDAVYALGGGSITRQVK